MPDFDMTALRRISGSRRTSRCRISSTRLWSTTGWFFNSKLTEIISWKTVKKGFHAPPQNQGPPPGADPQWANFTRKQWRLTFFLVKRLWNWFKTVDVDGSGAITAPELGQWFCHIISVSHRFLQKGRWSMEIGLVSSLFLDHSNLKLIVY